MFLFFHKVAKVTGRLEIAFNKFVLAVGILVLDFSG